MSLKHFSLSLCVGLATLTVVPSRAVATEPQTTQVGQDLAATLPEKTVLYFSIPDVARAEKRSANLPWTRLTQEEEIKTFFEKPAEFVSQKGFPALWKMLSSKTGIDFSFLGAAKLNAVEFAVTHFQMQKQSGELGLFISVKFAEPPTRINELAAEFTKKAGASGQIAVREEKMGDTTVQVLDGQKKGFEGAWFVRGSQLGLSLGFHCSEPAMARMLGKATGNSLSQEKDYQAAMGKVSANDSEMKFFLRVGPVIEEVFRGLRAQFGDAEMFGQMLKTAEGVVEEIGSMSVRAIAGSSTPQDTYSVNQFYVLAPGPRKGFMQAISDKPVDLSMLNRIPKESQSFSVFGIRLEKAWDVIWAAVRRGDESMVKEFEAHLAQLETQSGVKLKEDLIDSLGEQMIFYSLPLQNIMSPTPEAFALIEVKDKAKAEKAMSSLLKFGSEVSGEFQFKENESETGKSFSVSIPGLAKMGMLGSIVPTYGFTDKYMVLGLSKAGVKKAIKKLSAEPGEGAAGIAGFAQYSSQIPKDACSVGYSDSRPTITALYQAIQMFAPMATAGLPIESPIDFSSMPAANTITKNFFGSVSYSRFDDAGFYSKSFSPFGVDTVIGLGRGVRCLAGLGAGIYSEMSNKRGMQTGHDMADDDFDSEEEPEMSDSETHKVTVKPKPIEDPAEITKQTLVSLKSGLTVYKIENGKFPASLDELLKATNEMPQGYLPTMKAIPADAWKHAFIYQLDPSGKSYRLRSAGPNGQDEDGKGDDILSN